MNRRNFIKTVSMAAIASLIPFNLKADDNDTTDIRVIDTVCLDYIKYNNVAFNGVLNVTTHSKNDKITSFSEFFGDNTEEKLNKHYKYNRYAWFMHNKINSIENMEFLSEDLFQSYEYRIYGYYGLSSIIELDCKMNNKYKLRWISFDVMGITKNVEKIIISDFPSTDEYKYYPMMYNYYSKRLFGLTFDKINNTNIKSIILPEKMFEENKKYIPIIEKNTKIKFEEN